MLKTDDPSETAVGSYADNPTADDQLARRPFVQALVERMDDIHQQGSPSGFGVHLHGPWGSGKSSILLMMEEIMVKKDRIASIPKFDVGGDPIFQPRWAIVQFNAWENERRNPPWWPLMQAVQFGCKESLRKQKNYGAAAAVREQWIGWKLYYDWSPYIIGGLMSLAFTLLTYYVLFGTSAPTIAALIDATNSKGITGLLTLVGGLVAVFFTFKSRAKSVVFGSSNDAQFYSDISSDPLKRIGKLFARIIDKVGQPVCIFIDDLDRCDANYVVDLMEGIQTTFRHKNVAYVVAADRGWIRSAFEQRYEKFIPHVGDPGQPLGYLFLEKIFQLSLPIPGIDATTKKEYLGNLLGSEPQAMALAAVEAGDGPKVDFEFTSETAIPINFEKYDEKLQQARVVIAKANPKGLSHAQATDLSRKEDDPIARAAIALEFSGSRTGRKDSEHELLKFAGVFSDNPRVMLRMLNSYGLRLTIGLSQREDINISALARWTIMEQRFPALADELIERPDWIRFINGDAKKAETVPKEMAPFTNREQILELLGKGDDRLSKSAIESIIGSAGG